MSSVVIIGGGIIGLSGAYYLQRSGWQVTVIDKNDFLNNCSYGNAGYVCPSHFVPLAAPGILKQGLKWMLNSKSPFYVEPRLSKSLIDWGFKFIKSASKKHVEASAIPLRDLSLLSQHEYEQWLNEFDFAYEHKGLLEIFRERTNAEHAKHTVEKAHALGLDAELLDYEAMQHMEPQTKINGLGAIFFKCDAHLYPNKLMHGLIKKLKNAGVELIRDEPVIKFEKNNRHITKVITTKHDYDTDYAVVATGSWSRETAALLDIKIPLVAGRGYSVTLEDSAYKLNHPAILVEGRVAITPMDENKIRFGGTMEITSTNAAPRMTRVAGLLHSVRQFFPEFNVPLPTPDKIWYGYRPCSADGLPYIGKTKKLDNVVVATGHSMLGLSLGAGTGKLINEIINEQPTSIDMKAFDVERFG